MADQPIPTDTTDQQAVTVAQEDREAAANADVMNPTTNAAIRYGRCDNIALVQAFARHRLASVSSASAEGMSEAIADLDIEALASAVHDARWGQGSAASSWVPFNDETGTGRVYSLRIANAVQMHLLRLAADHVPDAGKMVPEPVPATNQAGEVNNSALIKTLSEFHRIMSTKFDPTCMFGADYDRKMMSNASKLVANLPAVIAALATQPVTSQEGDKIVNEATPS